MARWLFWTLVTILTWGIWSILSKVLSSAVPSAAHCEALSTWGIVPVVIALYCMRDDQVPRESGNRRLGMWLALASGIVSCLGNIAYFDVFSRGGKAAAVIPITALYPAVTVLLAIPLLKERVNWLQWLGIGLSLGAIYLFNVPEVEGVLSAWLLFALGPIVLWGVCGLLQKMSTNHISARSAAIWFLLAFVPVAVIIALIDPLPSSLSPRTWLLAGAVGFTLALGNFTILLAFSSGGKASIIAPLAGLYPLVAIPLAIGFLGEEIDRRESLGIICALVAVVLLSYQTSQESRLATRTESEGTP